MKTIPVLAIFLFFTCCKKDKNEAPVVIQSSGSITADVDAFRALLGEPLNTTPGNTTGRREINWDGVPDSLSGKDLPEDFFNPLGASAPAVRQRGLAYGGGSSKFRVSSNNFADVNSVAATQFSAFSGNKTFANISGKLWQVSFQVPGQSIAAGTKGFGAVFSDVDESNSTSLEFFNGSKNLGKFFVPPHDATTSFSFLGVYFKDTERITKVVVSHSGFLADGQADISENGTVDQIVMDDFIYGEPLAQ